MNRKTSTGKILALVLTLALVLGAFPTLVVSAAGTPGYYGSQFQAGSPAKAVYDALIGSADGAEVKSIFTVDQLGLSGKTPEEAGTIVMDALEPALYAWLYDNTDYTIVWNDSQPEYNVLGYSSDDDNFIVTGGSITVQTNSLDPAITAWVTARANDAKTKSTAYDKLKAVHDYLALNVTYDDNYPTAAADDSYEVAGVIDGTAVCEGYAKAFKAICDELGIECVVVTGENTTGPHMWNAVKLSGSWYAVDVTADDNGSTTADISYDYFLKGSDSMSGKLAEFSHVGFTAPTLATGDYQKPVDPVTPTISTTSLPKGKVGTAYSQTLSATGGTGITWSRTAGNLPGGLTLSTAGVISGTPTAAGTFTFTVRATNSDSKSADKSLTLIIDPEEQATETPTVTEPTEPTTEAPTSATKDDDRRSSSNSGGGGGGSTTTTTTRATDPVDNTSNAAPVSAAQAEKAVDDAVAKALEAGAENANVTLKNPSVVPAEAFQAMAESEVPVKFNADSMSADGKSVEVRITLDPSQAKSELNLAASTTNAKAKSAVNTFTKFFTNEVQVVSFEQKGGFGQKVAIAIKMELTVPVEELVIYSYDSATNTYVEVENPGCWVDSNGYLRFGSDLAGDIIVSAGPLVLK